MAAARIAGDGRPWMCGDQFTMADLAVYQTLWFLTDRSDRLSGISDGFMTIAAWKEFIVFHEDEQFRPKGDCGCPRLITNAM